MNFNEICRQIIAIDSSPSNGNAELVDFISGIASEMGFSCESFEGSYRGLLQKNIILSLGRGAREKETREKETREKSDAGPGLLLLTHLDTSDPGSNALWTQTQANPFKATVRQNKIFGLGVAGAKIDFLCKMFAASEFVGKNFKKPVYVVGTYGGQQGMLGLVQLLRHKRIHCDMGLVGEPTEERIVNTALGLTQVEIKVPFSESEMEYHEKHNEMLSSSTQSKIFSGEAVHSSVPSLGKNAIIEMLQSLALLPDDIAVMNMDGGMSYNMVPSSAFLEIDPVSGFKGGVISRLLKILDSLKKVEDEFHKYQDEAFFPTFSTLNLGKIRTTKTHIEMLGSCRVLPGVSEEIYEKWMESLRETCEECDSEFKIISNKKAFHTEESEFVVEKAKEIAGAMNMDQNCYGHSVCTEANLLSRFHIPVIAWGPGRGPGNTYQPNEMLDLDSAARAKQFYSSYIKEVCL